MKKIASDTHISTVAVKANAAGFGWRRVLAVGALQLRDLDNACAAWTG